jgi:membrane associated rhomboid family serine protease
MGVHDRAYMRDRGPPSISYGHSWTLRFIVLLAVVFVAVSGARGWGGWRGEAALYLSRGSIEDGRVWTLLTCSLLHADALHLAFNALGLWYFGKLTEESLGGARYLAFLVLASIAADVPFLAAEFASHGGTATIGASGIVMAALTFAAFRYPRLPFGFFGLPLLLWQLAVLYVALDVLGAASGTGDVNHLAHLGGAAFGWCVHRFGLLPDFRLPRRARTEREPGPFAEGNARAEIDRLLDKIAADGIGSLSEAEREFLKANSGRYR